MKILTESEMRNVNGGWYYCTKCKKFAGLTWFAAGLHVISAHGGNKANERFLRKY